MATIWKYKLQRDSNRECVIELPEPYQVLSCHTQGEDIYVWIKIEEEHPLWTKPVTFVIYGTGSHFWDDDLEFVGTAHKNHTVWHVFRRLE